MDSEKEMSGKGHEESRLDTKPAMISTSDAIAADDIKFGEISDDAKRMAHLLEGEEMSPEEKEADRKLLRKIDLHLLPLLMFTYGVQYSDKISLSSSVAFDLIEDTHLVGNDFAWLSTGFYLAFLAFEFPFGFIMQRFPLEKVLGFTVMGWGVCVLSLAACHNFTELMVVRAILGALEAPISPGFLIIITAWYKREEQVVRSLAFFSMNSFFSLFILMCNYGVGLAAVGSSIASWKAINCKYKSTFGSQIYGAQPLLTHITVFLGALSFTWGVVLTWGLCVPKKARWLTQEEKARVQARLVQNKTGESAERVKIQWYQVWECFVDPQIWFIALTTVLKTCASGGFSTFSTLILKSFGLNTVQTIAYQLPWYATQMLGVIIVGYIVNKYKQKIGFWITGFYTSSSFLIWSTTGLNVAGRTKKSTAQAIVFIAFCAGFCIGPQMFYSASAPQYLPGLYFCCACFVVCEIILGIWMVWVRLENKRRDKKALEMGWSEEYQRVHGCIMGLQDKTDRENPHFRYRY
ncbi:unnamed protein product [Clonostachys solani]|uniref:Allantoate permease n=1 Tax=Clonostachys solani TaxID=160281 RepID=A0A9N9ZMX2_9HYPO|nr:unnamed protein product [Clonostachys solani]